MPGAPSLQVGPLGPSAPFGPYGWTVAVSALVLSAVGCRVLGDFARRRHLLDHPNERSLHTAPVPRLGGVAIVLGSWIPCAVVWLLWQERTGALSSWLAASMMVAALGLIDDLRPLRARARFLIQSLVACAFCVAMGVPHSLAITHVIALELPYGITLALSVLWLVGTLNIFNFMDGMDGLAGTQALTAGGAIAIASWLSGRADLALVAAAIAAASGGFLLHNAPPARIFMGDAGSTYLGFSFASALLLGSTATPSLPIAVAPLALAPFLLDGTFTIFRRLSRREPVWKAHRSHLYQRAVQSGLTHRQVLVPYVLWSVAAGVSAVLASLGNGVTMAGVMLLMLGALGGIWRWVVGRERVQARAAG